jgi:hypothetical protein
MPNVKISPYHLERSRLDSIQIMSGKKGRTMQEHSVKCRFILQNDSIDILNSCVTIMSKPIVVVFRKIKHGNKKDVLIIRNVNDVIVAKLP